MLAKVATCYPSVNSNLRVPLASKLLSNASLMENKEIRRANMLWLAEQHGGLQALADATKTSAKYLSQVKTRWQGRGMGDKVAEQIEDALKKGRGWMDRLQVPPHRVGELNEPEAEAYTVGVPVVGTAQLGDDGYWLELDYPAGHGEGFVRYPMKDPNTYALRVKGDSMWPRIKPGEFVVIEPNEPIVMGEEVMVQTTDGRSMIKLLVSRRGGLVELHSINGTHKPITIEETKIAKIHFVGGILKSSLYYERPSP